MNVYCTLVLVCYVFLTINNIFCSDSIKSDTMPIWSNGVPHAKGTTDSDIPKVTIYLPEGVKTPSAAMLICPGGGYHALCSTYEGHDIAKWLNKQGIAGIVLQYRVSPYRHPIPFMDATRAMRLIRFNSKAWNIDPNRIGIIGFSAGGHLASTVGTNFDYGNPKSPDPVEHMSCRPDFMVLVYPVITMGDKTHKGSRNNLLGALPSENDVKLLSNELHATSKTPPTFITHSKTDGAVSVDNSRMFYEALKKNGVISEYFELPSGGHGLGCGKGLKWKQWQDACSLWLKKQKLDQ